MGPCEAHHRVPYFVAILMVTMTLYMVVNFYPGEYFCLLNSATTTILFIFDEKIFCQ